MKKLLVVLLFTVCAFAFGEDAANEELVSRAIEGATLLHSGMRDPDSFKIGRAWTMRSEKYGYAICYDYFSRNGLGGMNNGQAVYASASNKRSKHYGQFNLYALDGEYSAVFESRCGARAVKHDVFVNDLTTEVQKALANP